MIVKGALGLYCAARWAESRRLAALNRLSRRAFDARHLIRKLRISAHQLHARGIADADEARHRAHRDGVGPVEIARLLRDGENVFARWADMQPDAMIIDDAVAADIQRAEAVAVIAGARR